MKSRAWCWLASVTLICASARANAQARPYESVAYHDVWVDSGAVLFVRPVNDTTLMTLTVRYAPSRWQTSLSATYGVYAVRCDAKTADHHTPLFFVGSGVSEGDALMALTPVSKAQDVGAVGLESKYRAIAVQGCLEIDRAKASR